MPVVDLFFAGLILLYLMPMSVAHRRAHPYANSIEVLNLLLGWTIVGWVIALL